MCRGGVSERLLYTNLKSVKWSRERGLQEEEEEEILHRCQQRCAEEFAEGIKSEAEGK